MEMRLKQLAFIEFLTTEGFKDFYRILQHDYALPHSNRETQQGLQRLQFKEVLSHLNLQTDLAVFELFKIKECLNFQI